MSLFRRENLRKGVVLTIVCIIVLSNVIPLVFGDSDSDDWGNKLSDNIAYTKATGGYCKITAQGGKVGIKFPYVDSEILSIYLYKVVIIDYSYSYVNNGIRTTKNVHATGFNVGKKVISIYIPTGKTSFKLTNCFATFQFNSALLATGLWSWFVPRYQNLGPISDYA